MRYLRYFYLIVATIILLTFSVAFAEESKEMEKTSGNVSVGLFNRYVFRGYELSSGSIVIQPSVSVSYKGFSISYWGNIDTYERATQSFIPDRPGSKSFNESDLTLSYTLIIDKLSLTGGYIYYGTKYAAETEELFLGIGYDIVTKPTLTVYRDISSYPGTYINLSFSHSIEILKEITFDFGASFGYFKGEDSYWRTYDGNSKEYVGKKYNAFHDGKVQMGLTIPIAKNLTLLPVVQYWFPLSGKAKRIINGNPYNPNGHLDNTFVSGINLNFSF
ncbi:MAG: hypothetical protein N2511_01490 [Thermodesulfovibrionales bacterium]|nr:hypothetical protein [Thermodesulfovibrionales bacterium]